MFKPDPIIDPTLIPLPPSPGVKPRLPNRRPKGWTAAFDSRHPSLASINNDDHAAVRSDPSNISLAHDRFILSQTFGRRRSKHATSRGRIPSARILSSEISGLGRNVSGTMQYALLPSPPETERTKSGEHEGIEDKEDGERCEGSRNGSVHELEFDSEEEEDSPLLRARPSARHDNQRSGGAWVSQVPDTGLNETEEEEDEEVWVAYVRQQLASLFPDVHGAIPAAEMDTTSDDPSSSHQDPHIDVSPSSPSFNTPYAPLRLRPCPLNFGNLHTSHLALPRLVSDTSTISSSSTADDLRTPDTNGTFRFATRSDLSDPATRVEALIPNMRQEIGAMREEMQRLRGAIGFLTEHVRGDQRLSGAHAGGGPDGGEAEDASASSRQPSMPAENDDTVTLATRPSPWECIEMAGLPDGFLKNIHLCVDVVRAVHQACCLREESAVDTDIFEAENLAKLRDDLIRRMRPATAIDRSGVSVDVT